jgi:tRNA A58 N-methylase Trm61
LEIKEQQVKEALHNLKKYVSSSQPSPFKEKEQEENFEKLFLDIEPSPIIN